MRRGDNIYIWSGVLKNDVRVIEKDKPAAVRRPERGVSNGGRFEARSGATVAPRVIRPREKTTVHDRSAQHQRETEALV
jgi:hypothetical protein